MAQPNAKCSMLATKLPIAAAFRCPITPTRFHFHGQGTGRVAIDTWQRMCGHTHQNMAAAESCSARNMAMQGGK